MGSTSRMMTQVAGTTGDCAWRFAWPCGLLVLPLLLAGCFAPSSLTALLGDEPLPSDLQQPRLARSQADDKLAKPRPPDLPVGPPSIVPVAGTSALPLPPGGLALPPSSALARKITVGVWVNGEPIFTDEYCHRLFLTFTPEQARELNRLPPDQQNERLKPIQRKQRETVIDQEVLYQHAVAMLDKGNPKALQDLRQEAKSAFEKQYKGLRARGIPDDMLRDLKKLMYRRAERELIAMKFVGSIVFRKIQHLVGPPEVKEYYETHMNEFTQPETVTWQDIFIKECPTAADARRKAIGLLARCKNVGDFEDLLDLDQGDSKSRGGLGYGSRRRYVEKGVAVQDIRPPEAEDYLFKLQEGHVEIVDIATGVHIIRLLKHDPGGLQPFDEKLQLQIRAKLRNELAAREIKRLTRELRSRAVIEYARDEIAIRGQ